MSNKEFIDVNLEMDKVMAIMMKKRESIDSKISLLSSFDINGVVDEKMWHDLCETPFRESSLSVMVANKIFPLGENFKIRANSVDFEMLGFSISLPTTRDKGVIVDMNWFKPHYLEDFTVRPRYAKMRKYFELLDSGNYSWYDLAKCRCTREEFNKAQLFLWWFLKGKWHKVDRQKWIEAFEDDDKYNQKKVIERNNERSIMLNKIDRFSELVQVIKPFARVKGYVPNPNGVYMTLNIENYFDGFDFSKFK